MRADASKLPTDPDARAVGALLRPAVARIYSRFRSVRAEGEIGDTALYVLVVLDKHGPLGLRHLSDHAHATPGSMHQTVRRLIAGGYITRNPDPSDRRRVVFSVTPQGARAAVAAVSHRESWLEAKLSELTAQERAVLADAAQILQRIADS